MWFLTKLWVPFWLCVWGVQSYGTRHHNASDNGALAFGVFGWLAVNAIVTLVYIVTRVFRRATADGRPRV